jgi:hypothetical protein
MANPTANESGNWHLSPCEGKEQAKGEPPEWASSVDRTLPNSLLPENHYSAYLCDESNPLHSILLMDHHTQARQQKPMCWGQSQSQSYSVHSFPNARKGAGPGQDAGVSILSVLHPDPLSALRVTPLPSHQFLPLVYEPTTPPLELQWAIAAPPLVHPGSKVSATRYQHPNPFCHWHRALTDHCENIS